MILNYNNFLKMDLRYCFSFLLCTIVLITLFVLTTKDRYSITTTNLGTFKEWILMGDGIFCSNNTVCGQMYHNFTDGVYMKGSRDIQDRSIMLCYNNDISKFNQISIDLVLWVDSDYRPYTQTVNGQLLKNHIYVNKLESNIDYNYWNKNIILKRIKTDLCYQFIIKKDPNAVESSILIYLKKFTGK